LFALLGMGEAFESQRTLWLLAKQPAEACRRRAAALRFAWWTQATQIRAQRSWTLIAILVLAFGLQISAGSAHAFPQAALISEYVREGELWRLITGPLMHGDPKGFGIAHLAFNCFALFTLGRLVEQAAHRTLIFPIFASSAIAGAIATTLMTPTAISVGASGGILGLLGYLIALTRSRPGWIPSVMTASMLRSLVLLIGIGLLPNLNLDHAGHAGGLVMGMVWGLFWPPPLQAGMDRQPDHLAQLADRLGLAIVLLGLGVLWWRLQPPTFFDG
jgi:membrane associated rhomboid family serine protease